MVRSFVPFLFFARFIKKTGRNFSFYIEYVIEWVEVEQSGIK